MANTLGDNTLDNGLNAIKNNSDKVYICSADPTTYTEATSTYALGNNNFGAGSVAGAPAAHSPNGRQITVNAITAGSITATGTATKWAVVTSGSTRLDANGSLSASQGVTNGNTFTLAAFVIAIPNQ